VKFEKNKRSIVVDVSDDGKGFDANESYEGNGLKNMKQRAEQLNANFSIHSSAGSGTRINFEMKII